MKLNKILYAIPLVAILIATGCKKNQFNINRNINQPTDSTITYDVILPAALHASGGIMATQWGTIQNWMGYWARSGTYAPNVTEETYQITTGFGNGIWNNCYDNNYDYQIIISKAQVAGATFYEGISRIMRAHNFQILVDVYGNVPYNEALKGSSNATPVYDKGQDIYIALLRQIDAAMALIAAAPVATNGPNKEIGKNDIMFGTSQFAQGAATLADYTIQQKLRWLRFANTLKLRLLVHAYAVPAINKATEMAIITNYQFNGSAVGFMAAGQQAQIQPAYQTDKPNPFYNSYYRTTANAQTANNVYYRANEWGIGYYDYNGDSRISRFYEAGTDGLRGVKYGTPPINANASGLLAGIGPGVYKTAASPQAILTSAESFFLQAEARWRGWLTTGPTVKQLVDQGIQESFTYVGATLGTYISGNAGYSDVDAAALSNAPSNPPGTAPVGGLYTILSQKWFALNAINTLEVWTDYRRVPYKEVVPASTVTDHFVYGAGVGYDPGPPLSVSPQNTSTKIPVRYLYPQTEYNYNPTNVGAEGTINPFTSRIFWDLN